MNRRRNTIILIAGIAIIIVIALVAAKRGGSHAVAVREVTIHYGAFTTKLPETGVVQHPLLITIPAGVGGNMGLIGVKAGDRVVEGQVLATIVNPQLVSSLHDAEMTAMSSEGRSSSASQANAVLPAQNRSAVVQAEAAVVAARTQLNQARQDILTGQQSGLGFGGTSAEEQRLSAKATVDKAATDLREAKRTFDANNDLYTQKGISRDQLEQSRARLEQAQVTFSQAQSERKIIESQLGRTAGVLRDRVRSAEDQLRQSLAALDSARVNAAQNKTGDVEAARGDAARAEADLAFARDQVDRMSIRAPFSGIVQSVATQTGDTLRPLQPGDAITAGQPIFTMSDNSTFIVRTKVDEQDISGIRIGQRAFVGGEDFAGRKLAGHVVSISPLAQKSDDPSNTSRQIVTTIALDQTVPYLRDGMTVDVDIVTHNEPHVLAVPIDAVRKDDKSSYVFVQKAGKANRVDVTLGVQNDTSAVVKKGIADGDIVIADKSLAVTPNAAVTAAPSPSPGPSPAAT